MPGSWTRAGGASLAAASVLLAAIYAAVATGVYGVSASLFSDALFPFALSLLTFGAGVAIARGRLVDEQFAGRALAWTALGAVAMTTVVVVIVADTLPSSVHSAQFQLTAVDATAFGAVVGLLIGVYDARNRRQQADLDRLNRINDTLRIATQEIVHVSGRDDLEQAVCDQLAASKPYEAVWIGRYDEGESAVRPSAWAGMPDEYFESLVVTVDDTPTGSGAGGRAIKTRETQCVPDVFEDPTMEPWWDLCEEHGVESLAVVPIVDGDTVYGFYSIYADRPDVFDPAEREVLTELGETLGHAFTAIRTHERLARRERELERQNERLGEFASVVSHDLRNPLNVAEGRLELAREDCDSPHLDDVADAHHRMDELIEDLLTLARQGKTVSGVEAVPLRSVADDAWETVAADATTLRVEDDLGTVYCDESRLRELLENLFGNAVEHAGPEVTVTVGRTDDGFYVADDGPGVPEAERSEVFETGYSSTSDGTGFGLNIVRSIAEAHDWTVSLGESAAGGARFEFTDVEFVPAAA